MFNKAHQFYPTKEREIRKMLAPLRGKYGLLPHTQILEPSAGAGHILDYLTSYCNVKKESCYAIEIDGNLQATLSGKGYRVIDFDFMEYTGGYGFDLVIMNPPFRNGVKHLLKAWSIVRPGGDIACLLNAETVRNTGTSDKRVLAHLISKYGETENIGKAFVDAERRAGVEVVIVWLHKPAKRTSTDFKNDLWQKDTAVSDEEFSANPLAHVDILESLVTQYETAVSLLIKQNALEGEYKFYTREVLTGNNEIGTAVSLNEKIALLKSSFWRYVFDKTRVGLVVTTEYRKKFEGFRTTTSAVAFNVRNIKTVLSKFMIEKEDIMGECLLDVFDAATAYHKKNKIHGEGWKTNKSWKCNKKIILPDAISDYNWSPAYYRYDFLYDIDKVLCWLSGKDIATIAGLHDTMTQRGMEIDGHSQAGGFKVGTSTDYTEKFESEFFTIRIYKKGTVHLMWRDLELLDRFNQQAAEGKMWVGGGY